MSLRIRPYVSVAESIAQTAPNLLQVTMPTIIVGPAVDEKTGFDAELDFTVINNARISDLLALDSTGKVFKIAGIRPGATIDVSSLEFGAKELSSVVDFAGKELHFHVKSSTEKHILVLESGDNYVTEQDLLDKGVLIGDDLTINPPTEDDAPFTSKIRDFGRDDDGNLLVYLWDEVPYDVDETTSLTASITKYFNNVALTKSGFTIENVVGFSDSVLIKGPGSFSFDYFVYQPTDVTPDFSNIKVSITPLVLPNTNQIKITASAKDGRLFNWFVANRTDIANQIIDVNYNNYQTIIGKGTIKNKLGKALELIANEIPGFNVKIFVVENDSDDAYTKALNILSTSTKAYQVSCLSDSENVLNALIGAIKKGEQPEISAYKMGIFAPRLPLISKKLTLTDATITDNGDGTFTIETPTGGFSVSGIREGDVIIGSEDLKIADEEYYNTVGEPYTAKAVATVTTVITDKKLIVTPIISNANVAEALSGQNIVFISINNKDVVADRIKKLAESINNMHMVLVFPDKFIIDEELVPGYYVASLLAAIMGHLPPQQGLSNLSVRTVDRVVGSSFYYTDTELDEIAASGVTVLAQSSYDTPPFIIRQLTTNMNSLEEMEINKVRCLDYAALSIKNVVDGYVGKRNVTQRNVSDIAETIKATLNNIIRTTANDLLGSVITSYKINNIAIPEDEPDAITGDIEVYTPTSLNAIRLFVKSKS